MINVDTYRTVPTSLNHIAYSAIVLKIIIIPPNLIVVFYLICVLNTTSLILLLLVSDNMGTILHRQ